MREVFDKKFSRYITFFIIILLTFVLFFLKISEFRVRSFWGLNWDLHPDKAPLYRLIALCSLLVAMGFWASRWNLYEIKKISWWMPKRSGTSVEDQSWEDIISLILLTDDNDPITRSSDGRTSKPTALQCLTYLAFLLLSCSGFAVILDYIAFPRIPGLLLSPNNVNEGTVVTLANIGSVVQISSNLTAYLAILTAGVAIYVAKFSIRAQVRAQSRQKWINQVRKLTAELFKDIAVIFDYKRNANIVDIKINEAREHQMHLELLLNPSEKDHRLLMMLIRRCISPQTPIIPDEFLKRDILMSERAENILEDLRRSPDLSWILDLETQTGPELNFPRLEILARDELAAISYIARLTNIILKREWVRVRDAK